MDEDIAELFREAGRGNAEAVERMVRYRPELARARDDSTLSVLQFARYMEQREVLEILIGAGPPLDIFEAAIIDRAGRVRELLAADPSLAGAYSDDGFTPLHFAAHFGSLEAIAALLAAGAKTEAVTRNFLANMPLHAAAASRRRARCCARAPTRTRGSTAVSHRS